MLHSDHFTSICLSVCTLFRNLLLLQHDHGGSDKRGVSHNRLYLNFLSGQAGSSLGT